MTYTKHHALDWFRGFVLVLTGVIVGLAIGRGMWLNAASPLASIDYIMAAAMMLVIMVAIPAVFRSVWRSEGLAWDRVRELEATERGLRADLSGTSTEAFRLRQEVRRLEGVLSDTLTPLS